MAFDDLLADRIRSILKEKKAPFEEKKMMGGLTYMVNGKMCVGIVRNRLMARIDPEYYLEALTKPGCHEMDFTGRPMKGFVFIDPSGTDMDSDLEFWINKALEYNTKAQAGKKGHRSGKP